MAQETPKRDDKCDKHLNDEAVFWIHTNCFAIGGLIISHQKVFWELTVP